MDQSNSRDACSRSDSEDEDGYVEVPDTATDVDMPQGRLCLFCDDQSSLDADDLIGRHLRTAHGIASLGSLLASVGVCDQPAWVRLVSFLRSRRLAIADDSLAEPRHILEEFLATESRLGGNGDCDIPPPGPPLDDPLLYEVDIDELIMQAPMSASTRDAAADSVSCNQDSQSATSRLGDNKDQRIRELEAQVESLRSQVVGMTALLRRFAGAGDGSSDRPDDADLKSTMPRTIAELNDDEDEYYVDSYSGASIHAEMLQDRVRTGAYHDFMAGNPALFNGRTVLDVGCGTGILSMFAAKAGADRVLAVDCASVLTQAEAAARDNGLADRIHFHRGKLERLDELRGAKADAVVSEWMGYCLLYEGMLESVLYARDHCLKPGGAVYPRVCSLRLCGIDCEELYQRNALYFDNVYGVRLTYLKERCLAEPHVAYDLQSEWVATDSALLCRIDMLTARPYVSAKVDSTPVRLTASRDCQLHAIVGYFDVDFLGEGDSGVNVSFSTGPLSEVTHWGQTVFYLRSPVRMKGGQSLEFDVSLGPPEGSPRSLRVAFKWRDGTCSEFAM